MTPTETLLFRNSTRPVNAFTVVADPALNRTQLFARAARDEGAAVEVLPYARILAGDKDWADDLAGQFVRLESTGRDFAVETALLARGNAVGGGNARGTGTPFAESKA